jgi:hypothetical protein
LENRRGKWGSEIKRYPEKSQSFEPTILNLNLFISLNYIQNVLIEHLLNVIQPPAATYHPTSPIFEKQQVG